MPSRTNRRKPLGRESPIGPCIATHGVDNRQAGCFRNDGCRYNSEMDPQEGRTASPLRARRQPPYRLRKTTLSLGWAECRKKIGIEPKESCLLLTFPLIGLVRFPHLSDLRTQLVTNSLLLTHYCLPLSDRLVTCSRVMRRSSLRFTFPPLSILLEIMVSTLI